MSASPSSLGPPPAPAPRRHDALVKIASGGTAAVWVGAKAGASEPLVALKRPHAHLADDPAFRKALVAEATIASRLHHPNVVDVRDVEEDEDGITLVMRYVEGASLSELIRSWAREPPPRAAACALRVALDTCAGLGALHDLRDEAGNLLGVVHRDVSPANVLVAVDGIAAIADFGLAKPLYAVERTTSEGALRGKLGYMAPEYVRGKEIDARIDVFAMGVVVWEALARKRLFRGENDAATLERVQRMQAPRLAEIAPELGPAAVALDEVLARALAKEPEERTPSAAALARELTDVASAHGLLADHAEVAASFGPALRGELEARRAKVADALARRATSPVTSGAWPASLPPAASPVASESTVRVPREARSPGARRVVLAVGILVPLAAFVVTFALRVQRVREAGPAAPARASALALPPASASPPSPSPSTSALSSSQAGDPPATSAPATSTAPSASAPGLPARPSARPVDSTPGHKKPRPNPYGAPLR